MVRLEFGREGGVVMLGQGDRVEVGAVRGRRNGLVRESALAGSVVEWGVKGKGDRVEVANGAVIW